MNFSIFNLEHIIISFKKTQQRNSNKLNKISGARSKERSEVVLLHRNNKSLSHLVCYSYIFSLRDCKGEHIIQFSLFCFFFGGLLVDFLGFFPAFSFSSVFCIFCLRKYRFINLKSLQQY